MGGANIQKMMQQAQKMQNDLKNKQAELQEKLYVASSGGGAVACVFSGKKELMSLEIQDEVLEDKEMLCDLIISCINDAVAQSVKDEQDVMGSVTGGLF